MSHPHEDGRQVVARGRIRVDARRALAKLREHLLIDLHLYATEIARSAVAAKAKTLDIDYDVDDVILTFDGVPAAPNDLPRLLDHVLGDGQSSDRHLRSLALGVNAALGLAPAYVDIFVRPKGEARTARIRFVPAVLESEDGELPSIEWITPPKGMPEQGTRVQFHRRIGMGLLKRAASRETPREILFLADALHGISLQVTSRGAPFALSPRARVLLRVPFKERDFRHGTLEILAAPAGSQIEWLELGVTLVRKTFLADPILPSIPHAQIELPIRVIIDADELPTNASRSSLREDVPWPKKAEQAAREALVLAIQSLVALVTRQGKPLPGVEVVDADPKKLEDALGAMVCVVAGASRRSAELSEQARSLLDLPLLQNAIGQNISVNTILSSTDGDVFVHQGKEAFDADLAHWLDEVVWLRGKIVERFLVDFAVQDAKAIAAQSLVARERRRVLHARPSSNPVVPHDPGHIVKETFHIEKGPFAGLRGQLALGAEGQRTGQRPTSIRIYFEGRHLDTWTIDRDKLPASMDAAIAWDGYFDPKFTYEGVLDSPHLRLAFWQLTRMALVALGMYFEKSVQENRAPEERAQVLPIARAAIGAFLIAEQTLGVDHVPEEISLAEYGPLWSRGIWLSANPLRLPISLAELKAYADRTKAICYVGPGVSGTAPDGRPVVVLTNLEKEWLSKIFPEVTFVPYDRALHAGNGPTSTAKLYDILRSAHRDKLKSAELLPSMTFEIREGHGILTPSVEDECLSLHAGVLLTKVSMNRFVEPAMIVLEHDAIVPNPTWDGVVWSREASALVTVRNDFLEKIVLALEGNVEARRSLRNFPSEPGPILRAYLIEAVARFRTKELAGRIEKLPLVYMLDEESRPKLVSLAQVTKVFPDPKEIPFLREVPPFLTLEWKPLLLLHDREVSAMFRWAGNRMKNADEDRERRAQLAQGEMQRRIFLQRPRLRLDGVAPLADPDAPRKVWQEQPDGSGENVAAVVAALPRHGLVLSSAQAEIAYEERLVCSRPLFGLPVPIVVRVFLPSDRDIVAYADVSVDGMKRIEALAYSAACALAADLVTRAKNDEACLAFFNDRRNLELIRQLYACSVTNPSRSDILSADFALRAAEFAWPTVQGPWRAYPNLVLADKKLYYGTTRYTTWEAPKRGWSELDSSIVYLPPTIEGTLMRDILSYMGHELVDVSSAIYALQNRRKSGSTQSGPTLSGSPIHSALRTTLESVGIDEIGEIELIDGANTTVHVETLQGAGMQLEVASPVAFRAIVRIEDLEITAEAKKKLAEKLAKGAIKFVESLAERLVELPYFVRAGLRSSVVKYAKRGKTLSKRRQTFEVFPDVLGKYHCIGDLAADGESPYPYVTIVPTHPMAPRARAPLCLAAEEVAALSKHLPFEDVTEELRREIMAEDRRRAPQLAYVGLSTTQRLECLDVIPLEGGGMEGEIGILAPENASKRSILIHKNRRKLCELSDAMGWPVLAVINDDSIPENKSFDGIRGNGAKTKVRREVQAKAESVFAKWSTIPQGVLVGRQVNVRLLSDSLVVMGALWLPPSWHSAGSIDVRDASNRFPMSRTFAAPKSTHKFPFIAPIPVGGRLFVANTGSAKKPQDITIALSTWLFDETKSLVLEAVTSGKDPQVVRAYQWAMRLFGADMGPLEAEAADGRKIDSAEIIATLETKGEMWVTARVSDIEGQFPADLPFFILRGHQQPLVEVLRARTDFVREFAATIKQVAAVPKPSVAATPFQTDKREPSTAPLATLPLTAPAPVEIPLEDVASSEKETSWFKSLVQRVVVFFDRPDPLEPWTKELGPSLMLAIDKLGLTPTSVLTGVRYVRRGRPMVFEEATGTLIINRSHAGVRTLAARVTNDPKARLLLVVLAVREINRVLEVVTDATERRVLLALLRGESL